MSSHQGWQRSSPNHSAMAGLQPSNSLFSIARLALGCYFYDGKPFHLSQLGPLPNVLVSRSPVFPGWHLHASKWPKRPPAGLTRLHWQPYTMAMNRACSHHVKWSMDDHQGPPVDHGRERPAKRCLLQKVTKEATGISMMKATNFKNPGERNMELHFLY